MPNVTVTLRSLRNERTGIDLSIPDYRERRGRLQNSVECNVVTVSNLPCFKTPQHKPSDTIQFMVSRQFEEFEAFRRSLLTAFPGTILPELPKSLLSFVGASIKQQVVLLDKFVKHIAATPKLAASVQTIQFLGFSPLSARKLHQKKDIFEELPEHDDHNINHRRDLQPDLFQDGKEEEEEDLFRPTQTSPPIGQTGVQLFGSQDYGGQVARGDELVMIAGATDPDDYHQGARQYIDPEEEDLLNIEDNLEELRLGSKPKVEKKKPNIPSKPLIAPKPASKPQVPTKPAVKQTSDLDVSSTNKPIKSSELFQDTQESDIFAESSSDKVVVSDEGLFDLDTEGSSGIDLDSGDIMKYITENTKQDDEDLDLFS